jgi:hypothetical protein
VYVISADVLEVLSFEFGWTNCSQHICYDIFFRNWIKNNPASTLPG